MYELVIYRTIGQIDDMAGILFLPSLAVVCTVPIIAWERYCMFVVGRDKVQNNVALCTEVRTPLL